ncbi:MAG: hypothetical protein WC485_11860 [Opitutaceae bacterium]
MADFFFRHFCILIATHAGWRLWIRESAPGNVKFSDIACSGVVAMQLDELLCRPPCGLLAMTNYTTAPETSGRRHERPHRLAPTASAGSAPFAPLV